MKKIAIPLILLLLVTVVSAGTVQDFNLKFGEDANVDAVPGTTFKIRARETSQIAIKLTDPKTGGEGLYKVIVDEIGREFISVRASVNGGDFEEDEISTNNNLRGTDNHKKVNLYGGNAPEFFYRPEIINLNGEREDRSVVFRFNIYSDHISGEEFAKMQEEMKKMTGENTKEDEGPNYLYWAIAALAGILLITIFTRNKKSKPGHSFEHKSEKVVDPVVDIKEEHKTVEPKKKTSKSKK